MNPAEYAEGVVNDTSRMIRELTTTPDGSTLGMSDVMASGVITAQSNLAIAAALMLIAKQIEEFRQ